MKTIKERAWEKYPEVIKRHNLALIDINEEKRKMYIEIATEQKVIDDERIAELEREKALLILEVHNKNKLIAELKATGNNYENN